MYRSRVTRISVVYYNGKMAAVFWRRYGDRLYPKYFMDISRRCMALLEMACEYLINNGRAEIRLRKDGWGLVRLDTD